MNSVWFFSRPWIKIREGGVRQIKNWFTYIHQIEQPLNSRVESTVIDIICNTHLRIKQDSKTEEEQEEEGEKEEDEEEEEEDDDDDDDDDDKDEDDEDDEDKDEDKGKGQKGKA